MRFILNHVRKVVLLLLAATIAGCSGSGDAYDCFDSALNINEIISWVARAAWFGPIGMQCP